MSKSHKQQKGVILILAPFLLLALMAFSALVIDLGVMRVAGAQLQTAVDSAALAAANSLPSGNTPAINAATYIMNNTSIIGSLAIQNQTIEVGTWSSSNATFTPTQTATTAARVTASVTPPLFFSALFFNEPYTITKSSTASLIGGPRDIMLIVDLSPGMAQYSQFSAYPTLPIATIENNLHAIYNALNLPQLGNLSWTPVTLTGNTSSILTALNLTNVAYPYPDGTWSKYIQYVKGDSKVAAAGYANKYGYATFVNYLISQEPSYSQTPTLWKTPEQPLQSVKNNITDFVSNSLSSYDRIALVTYNYTQGNTAYVEVPFTTNFTSVPAVLNGSGNSSGRQAAHYSINGNMLSGISTAIDEFNANGRPDAEWVVYLLTAAQLTNNGIAAILNQVQSAAQYDITLNTITIGTSGNFAAVQQISKISGNSTTQSLPSSQTQSLGQMSTYSGSASLVK